jgi:carbon monoxide dehydrogenase subunit G
MPHAIEESVEIRATPEQVFDFVQDPAQRASWDEGVLGAERRGDELAIRYRVLGPLSCEMVFEYTLFDRPKRSAVKLVRSRGPCLFASAGGAWFYEPTAGGTRFTTRFTFQTRGIPAALVRGSIEKATRRSLAQLKARLDSRESAPSSKARR